MARKHIWPIAVLGRWRFLFRYVLIPVWQAKFRYRKVLKRIRAYPADRKIKVLFVTGTPAKWKSQSLYDLMVKDDRFDPCICQTICDLENTRCNHKQRVEHLKKCREFFESRGMRYVEAYSREEGTWKDLNDFNADLVFYNQPWDLARNQLPHWVAKTALTFQIPYYVPNRGAASFDVGTPFQRALYVYVALNEMWAEFYKQSVSRFAFAGKIVGLGHTALDYYYFNGDRSPAKRRVVIYAPHWGFKHPRNPNRENFSTVLWTGRPILDYARKHSEVDWVFKPHPTLRSCLERTGVWTKAEIDEYYSSWGEIGWVHVGGDYEGLFVKSSALITDSDSFLLEYACTGHPIVHLISPEMNEKNGGKMDFLLRTYYRVCKLDELGPILDRVIIDGDDYDGAHRVEMIRKAGIMGNCAAKNIINWVDEELLSCWRGARVRL